MHACCLAICFALGLASMSAMHGFGIYAAIQNKWHELDYDCLSYLSAGDREVETMFAYLSASRAT